MYDQIKNLFPSKLRSSVRNIGLYGKDVACPICKSNFVTFLPFGNPPRANAKCPSCGSLERTRIFWKYLNQLPGFFDTPKKFLHVAPHKALFKRFSSNPKFEYHPIDRFEPGYGYPKGTVDMDITDLKYPDNLFDFFLCAHVLEHVYEDRKAISEFYRVTKSGGFGLIQVPLDLELEETFQDDSNLDPVARHLAYGQHDHVRLYGRDLKDRLEEAGFKAELEDFVLKMSAEEKFRYGIGHDQVFYVVRKI
jgi:hypothetical protein